MLVRVDGILASAEPRVDLAKIDVKSQVAAVASGIDIRTQRLEDLRSTRPVPALRSDDRHVGGILQIGQRKLLAGLVEHIDRVSESPLGDIDAPELVERRRKIPI